MRRRQFLRLVCGVAAWPLAARAQQRPVPVIGFLNPTSPDAFVDRLRAFRQGLKDTGYVEGENVTIAYRWADGHFDRLPALAAELVHRQVAVIVSTGSRTAHSAVKDATATIPIVFSSAEDPVRVGLVASLARPGANLTGVNFLSLELVAKRLELFHQLVPGAVRIAVLVNPANPPTTEATLRDVEPAARKLGLQTLILNAGTSREIDVAFTTIAHERPDALFVGGDTFYNSRRVQLANLSARYAMPAAFSFREFAEAGGLMSYGTDVAASYRQVGAYAGRILQGTKPADLPVVQSSKFELVINAQTARMLGITVPPTMLAIADEVVE